MQAKDQKSSFEPKGLNQVKRSKSKSRLKLRSTKSGPKCHTSHLSGEINEVSKIHKIDEDDNEVVGTGKEEGMEGWFLTGFPDDNEPPKKKVKVLVDYELPEGDDRLEWDTDAVRRIFGEIE